MKLSGAQKVWEILGWVVAGYSIYDKLKTMTQIKNDLFPYMSPETQALMSKYLGAPTPATAQAVSLSSGVLPALPTQASSTLTQVKSGT